MPKPEHARVPLRALRESVARAVAHKSYRIVGAEIGLSAMAVRDFALGDTEPRDATLRKVSTWYHTFGTPYRDSLSADVARGMVASLLEAFPERLRDEQAREVVAELAARHRRHRLPVPPWLRALLDRGGDAEKTDG